MTLLQVGGQKTEYVPKNSSLEMTTSTGRMIQHILESYINKIIYTSTKWEN